MTDQNIAGDLPYVVQEAEVQILVGQPGQLQVAIHIRTVRVPISEVPVMMFLVGGHGEPRFSADADCKES